MGQKLYMGTISLTSTYMVPHIQFLPTDHSKYATNKIRQEMDSKIAPEVSCWLNLKDKLEKYKCQFMLYISPTVPPLSNEKSGFKLDITQVLFTIAVLERWYYWNGIINWGAYMLLYVTKKTQKEDKIAHVQQNFFWYWVLSINLREQS